jgi:catechol 2,3-dioxygenase-like lactoylglutathione lyase family enzyme
MKINWLGPVFLCCTLLFSGTVAPAPVADEDRAPLDLRRTTLIVSDIDKSLAFYRDALGMVVIYDNMVNTPREAKTVEEAERARRLVFLRANDDYIGVLGLLQYLKPIKEPLDLSDRAFDPGTTVLVINHSDIQAAFERASQVEGVQVLSEPSETHYPSYDSSSTIRVMVSVLQDPDGIAVEVNQLLDKLQ